MTSLGAPNKNEPTRSSFTVARGRMNQEEHDRNLFVISLFLLYTYCHSETLENDDQATVFSRHGATVVRRRPCQATALLGRMVAPVPERPGW
jgi:hypothetical protein